MSETITAIYENGVLRPLSPVSLKEGESVLLQVWSVEPKKRAEMAVQSLVDKGFLTPPPHDPNISPVTDEEVHELAKRLGAKSGKPLSEIVIEDRGLW